MAFVVDHGFWRNHDHAKAAFTPGNTPGSALQDPQSSQEPSQAG
jgi:hypothetical protein